MSDVRICQMHAKSLNGNNLKFQQFSNPSYICMWINETFMLLMMIRFKKKKGCKYRLEKKIVEKSIVERIGWIGAVKPANKLVQFFKKCTNIKFHI